MSSSKRGTTVSASSPPSRVSPFSRHGFPARVRNKTVGGICRMKVVGRGGRGSFGNARCSGPHTELPIIHESLPTMSYHLRYGISKRTPPSPKALRDILDAQTELNRNCSWTHERLNLTPERTSQQHFGFPMVRFGNPRFALAGQESTPADACHITNAAASGSTKVRDNLWNAWLVLAFLKECSERHPELLFELRDDGGFVLPGAVWIRNGKVELQREWLNRERERAIEASGDVQAAAPFVWAEAEALEGRFFQDAPVSEHLDIPEIRDLGIEWQDMASMGLGDVADLVVDHVTSRVAVTRAA